jgi:two-component system, OmpR family, response regulator MtrA
LPPVTEGVSVKGVRIFGYSGRKAADLVWQEVNAATAQRDSRLFVAAVTRDVSARADLARQLPGESVLLLFPDRATAVRALSEGDLGADPPGDDGSVSTPMDDGLLVDPLRLDVTWNGISLRLTKLERAVLASLAEPPVRAWSYEHLYRAAWGDTWLGDTSALHATVKRLRRKLRDAGVTVFLKSIRGVGFRLDTEDASVAVAQALAGEPLGHEPGPA